MNDTMKTLRSYNHKRKGIALTVMALGFVASACGTSMYQPSRSAGFELHPAAEVDDEAIAAAFGSKPQLPDRLNVAYYSFAPDRAPAIESMLRTLPGVEDVYHIPSLLADGSRRFDDPRRHHYRPTQAKALSIKKLRLLAARARCDVLLIVDYGYQVEQEPNGWVATSPLLVPMLFAPWLDVVARSYLDVYAIDTRNGYLYGQVESSHTSTEASVTIYSAEGDALIEQQFEQLTADSAESLQALFTAETGAQPAVVSER